MKKIMKLLTTLVCACMLIFTADPALAASSKGGFSGGRSPAPSAGSHYSGSTSGGYSSGSGTYRSGVQRPSSSVTQQPRSNYGTGANSSHWGSFFGGMAAGALAGSLFGHMLHPFGGYYGYGHGFSLFGLLIDGLLIYIGYRIVRRLFFR